MPPSPRVYATLSRIHSLVHVTHAREKHGTGAVTFSFLFNSRLMYPSLVGSTGMTSAQRLCLPRREFLVAAENLAFDIVIGPQVSKPCAVRD
jgi:hypothetical protein